LLKNTGAKVSEYEEEGWIHAWPVVKLFLSNEQEDRQAGLRKIVDVTADRISRRKNQ
jgi:hypothetical protein